MGMRNFDAKILTCVYYTEKYGELLPGCVKCRNEGVNTRASAFKR
jgi:hypothetical protein